MVITQWRHKGTKYRYGCTRCGRCMVIWSRCVKYSWLGWIFSRCGYWMSKCTLPLFWNSWREWVGLVKFYTGIVQLRIYGNWHTTIYSWWRWLDLLWKYRSQRFYFVIQFSISAVGRLQRLFVTFHLVCDTTWRKGLNWLLFYKFYIT